MKSTVRKVLSGAVLVALMVGAATGVEAVRQGRAESPSSTVAMLATSSGTDTTSPGQLSQAFRRATERALPGVVHVQTEGTRSARVEVPEPFRGSPWEDFFRRGPSDPQPRRGSGSGFIFRSDGYILTNNHVVDQADRVRVILQDRREFDARIIGRDPNTDIAVLKIDATDLPIVALGDSDPVEVGDWVIALGYPLQLGSTATAGIVSAKGRRLGIIDRSQEAAAPLEHFIQTDAAINPGNSGGPLVDLEGRAIAINSAIASPTGYYSGYGFAVPINLARSVANDLMAYGEVRRPKLGVAIADVTPADAEVFRLDRPEGAAVKEVERGGPADRAGVQLGDVIVGVEGKRVRSSGELMELLARSEPGKKVDLDLIRYGEKKKVSVELGAFEPAVRATERVASESESGLTRLGFTAADLNASLARRLRLEATKGVVVTQVSAGSPAATAGIAPGMIIERVNGKKVGKLSDLESVANSIKGGDVVSLVVRTPDDRQVLINYRTRG